MRLRECDLSYLRSAVQSLASSTRVTLAANGATAEISGRCSPYTSHRTVEYRSNSATSTGNLAIIAINSRYALAVYTDDPEDLIAPWPLSDDSFERESLQLTVPRTVLTPLLREVERWIGPVQLPSVVHVMQSVHVLDGFDEAGRPVWRKAASISDVPEIEVSDPFTNGEPEAL